MLPAADLKVITILRGITTLSVLFGNTAAAALWSEPRTYTFLPQHMHSHSHLAKGFISGDTFSI